MNTAALVFRDRLALNLKPVRTEIFNKDIKRPFIFPSVPCHAMTTTNEVSRRLQFQTHPVHVFRTAEGSTDTSDKCIGLFERTSFQNFEHLCGECQRRKDTRIVTMPMWHRAKPRDKFSQSVQLICDSVFRAQMIAEEWIQPNRAFLPLHRSLPMCFTNCVSKSPVHCRRVRCKHFGSRHAVLLPTLKNARIPNRRPFRANLQDAQQCTYVNLVLAGRYLSL